MSTVADETPPLLPPDRPGTHTVAECDAVLARRPAPDVIDAWLDERLLAMRSDRDAARAAAHRA